MNDLEKKLCECLFSARRKIRQTQGDLARAAGISQVRVSKIERAEGRLSVAHFVALCDVLHLDPSSLLRLAVGDQHGPDEDDDDDDDDDEEDYEDDSRSCDLPVIADGATISPNTTGEYNLNVDHLVDGAPRTFVLTESALLYLEKSITQSRIDIDFSGPQASASIHSCGPYGLAGD